MSDLPARAPAVNHETKRFWDGTAHGRIELPRCDNCGLVIWYPRAICPDCQSTDLTWEILSGEGSVYSFTVARGGVGRSWKEHLPFVVAYVELAEGPIVLTNIVDCDPEDVTIGMAVTAVFDPTGSGKTDADKTDAETALVRFRRATSS